MCGLTVWWEQYRNTNRVDDRSDFSVTPWEKIKTNE